MIYHRHHIVPKHMGGTDDPSNLITLTLLGHAFAHWCLWMKFGKLQDKWSWLRLSGKTEEAEACRIELARQPKSVAHRAKMSASAMGNTRGLGVKRMGYTEEHKQKISVSQKKRLSSPEARERMRQSFANRGEEWKRKISEAKTGVTMSAEARQHNADARRGKKRGPYKKRIPTCHPDQPHCGHGLCEPCYLTMYYETVRKRKASEVV